MAKTEIQPTAVTGNLTRIIKNEYRGELEKKTSSPRSRLEPVPNVLRKYPVACFLGDFGL